MSRVILGGILILLWFVVALVDGHYLYLHYRTSSDIALPLPTLVGLVFLFWGMKLVSRRGD